MARGAPLRVLRKVGAGVRHGAWCSWTCGMRSNHQTNGDLGGWPGASAAQGGVSRRLQAEHGCVADPVARVSANFDAPRPSRSGRPAGHGRAENFGTESHFFGPKLKPSKGFVPLSNNTGDTNVLCPRPHRLVGQPEHWAAPTLDSERFLECLLVSGRRCSPWPDPQKAK